MTIDVHAPALPDWALAPQPLTDASLRRYLAFIGQTGRSAPSVASLAELQLAHLLAIPFETLSPMANEPVPLDEQALVGKLLSGRRGGYCFEQNLLFAGALAALGYDVQVLAARAVFDAGPEPRPRSHVALRVMLDDRPWLADVGFGRSPFRAPVALDLRTPQACAGQWFLIGDHAGELVVSIGGAAHDGAPPGAWEAQYLLSPQPLYAVDCDQLNLWVSTDDRSVVRQQVIVLRPMPHGRRAIRGGVLMIDEPGRQVDRELAVDELDVVLREEFGLVPPSGIAALTR